MPISNRKPGDKEEIPTTGGKYRRPHPDMPSVSQTHYESEVRETTWKDIYVKAKSKDLWIFDPADKEWYSPEEFKARFERWSIGTGKHFDRMQVRHPSDGLAAGYKILATQQNKLEGFAKRVIEYYKDKAKPGK